MQRRWFLKNAGAGLAAGSLAAPAIVQAQSLDGRLPEIKWRLASSFPKSLDTIFIAAETMAQRVAAASGNRFQIRVFPAGEIVPGPQVLDAVKDGTVEMGHSASYYFVGKDPTFAFDCAMPFGLNSRQQSAWIFNGGGLELMRELFRGYHIYNIPLGNTGVQMGGWYRKEINSIDDLKGLKMRIGGFAGQVIARLGAVPQQIPGGDIYPALEKGTIDAAEWVGPYDDLKLGFNKVAKYYYYPGWWEGGPQLTAYVNIRQWNGLPKEYQAILEDACMVGHIDMQTRYDAKNPGALKELIGGGTVLKPFPAEVMAACYKAALELYDETAAKNPRFRKVYEAWRRFRDEQLQWFAVAENRYDNFMQATRVVGRKN
ncbi:MAG: TRAP transporter substrate-binding protein [Sterolibacteriaceae bacterium]|nr:TRAP transporter substrate-binding protein [Sterolibacteriaceae bacterium]MBK9086433.1 TRAP transporter substrate-binding protein [Sterolibacteriaceae bacterium]